jgi:hypothetical protein
VQTLREKQDKGQWEDDILVYEVRYTIGHKGGKLWCLENYPYPKKGEICRRMRKKLFRIGEPRAREKEARA